MDKLFKGRKGKGPKVVNSVPSQNASPSTEQSDLPIERIDWAVEIAGIVKDVSEASPLLAPLKASCLLIIRGLEVAREMHQNRLDLQDITEVLKKQEKDMEVFAVRLEGGDMNGSPVLQSKLEIYLKNIHEALVETTAPVKETKHQRFDLLRRTRPTSSTQEEIPNIKQKLDSSYRDFMDAALLVASEKVEERASLAVKMHEVSKKVEYLNQQEQVEQSEYEPEYDYDSPLPLLYGHGIPCCQPGTRTAILADINQWAMDTGTNEKNEKIYWLKDAAGTGKTTVAATCARDWQVKQRLAGRFFFTPNSEASSGIDRFCTTVAKDIAFLIPSLDGVIAAALDELSQQRRGFHEQFERLIVKPLLSSKLSHPVVFIFDALDNCDPDGRRILLNCLLEHLPNISRVKVLLTSRPSPDIVSVVSTSILVRGQEVQLLDIHDEVRTDVRIYVHSTLTRLDDQEREKVVEYSGGLFIVAATACRMLRLSRQPGKLLNKLLNADSKDHLDELYLEVLRQAVWNGGTHEKMMSVLQIIIVTFQPVSINTIAYFLAAKFDVGKFVQDLGAVLKDGHPERPIKVLHPTFRDFLANFERANGFLVSKSSSHSLTAIGCLDTLEKLLRYDTLGLRSTRRVIPRNSDVENLEKRVHAATTAAVRYASSYWAYHVTASQNDPKVWLRALDFLSAKLLNWIELMSWRGSLADCVQGLSQLRVHVLPALRGKQGILEKAQAVKVVQAYQFLLQHQPILQASALHTYSAALAFTPKSSPLFENYRQKHISGIPGVISTTPYEWPTHDVLTGHSNVIQQVEFSPDSTRLATRAHDRTLRLWDASSGAIVGHPFRGEPNISVQHFAFSERGDTLAFATGSKIYLWSSATGNMINILDLTPWEVQKVAFHPIEPYVLSTSAAPYNKRWDRRGDIRLCAISDGETIGKPMSLETEPICSAISPDGLRIVSVCSNDPSAYHGTVSLWTTETFTQLKAYKMLAIDQRLCVAYSGKGDRFISWDQEGIIYLRDGVSGNSISDIKAHNKGVSGACFSPDGRMIASYGERDTRILIWSPENGLLSFSLATHTEEIIYISFSRDGRRLASVSLDQTVRVWDTTTGTNLRTFFTGYTGSIYRPALSPDWAKFVTVSITNQLNLYDSSGDSVPGEDALGEDMHYATPTVAFSPKGNIMVCGYSDLDDTSTMGLWRLETAMRAGQPMLGHKDGITCVTFSPDASYIVSGSKDGTIRFWDAVTGAPTGGILQMRDPTQVIFSPDGTFIASSSSHSIQVWDACMLILIWSINRTYSDDAIAFSPDGLLLAGSAKGLCVWSVPSISQGTTQVVGRRDDISFSLLAFGVAGILASANNSHIQIWKINATLELLAEVTIQPHSRFNLGISFDGNYLTYGSAIWDIRLPPAPQKLPQQEQISVLLKSEKFPHSLITYKDGSIYCASTATPLMPIPGHLRDQFQDWHSYGERIVVWTQGKIPVLIDCSPLIV